MLFPTLLSISQSQTWDFKEFVSKPNFLECLLLKKHHFRVYLKNLGLHYSKNIFRHHQRLPPRDLLRSNLSLNLRDTSHDKSAEVDIITKRCSSITIFLPSLLRKLCFKTQLRIAYSLMNISISIGSFHIQVVQCSLECIQVVLKYFYPRLIIEQNQLRIYSFLPKQ